MTTNISNYQVFSSEVNRAKQIGLPIVALESTVITHGLPKPENLHLAQTMESTIREHQAVPATIALLDGKIHIGLEEFELEKLSVAENTRKVSRRDLAIALAGKETGGTTVAGTSLIAHQTGIQVFATGGIGGVHRNTHFDISADLQELSHTPIVVVCAGAKAILDLPNTVEYLETMGVPVLGYRTNEFPAFYSRSSGLPVVQSVEKPEEIAEIALVQWTLGLKAAILVVQPPPEETALPREEIEEVIEQALRDADAQQIRGPAVTPFLLSRVSELSHGSSLKTNLDLLINNAALAAQIAVAISQKTNTMKLQSA